MSSLHGSWRIGLVVNYNDLNTNTLCKSAVILVGVRA